MQNYHSNVRPVQDVSQSNPADWQEAWQSDLAQIEMELEARRSQNLAEMREISRHDQAVAIHCEQCGLVAAGTEIGGAHVQLCDSCIVDYVLDNLGTGIVRDRLAEREHARLEAELV